MTKHLFFLLGIVLFACNPEKKSEKAAKIDFSYTVDTVQIDAGNHLFFLGFGLTQPRLSPDERYLFFYDNIAHAIEKVDLINRKYVQTIDLDKEGPKGISWLQDYVVKANQTFHIVSPRNYVALDTKGELLEFSEKFDDIFKVSEEKKLFQALRISPDLQYLFGLTSNFNQKQMLGWIDMKDSIYREAEIDSMSYRNELGINISNVNMNSFIDADYLNEKITVFHGDGIDLYTLNPKTGKMIFHDYNTKLIEKRRPGNYPKNVESGTKDSENAMELWNKEITFRSIVFNNKDRHYYRIATKWTESQSIKDIPHQYLLIFDEDLSLLHEEDLSDFPAKIFTYFVSNGKLWVHNREKEDLEFFVFDFSIN